MVLTIMLALSLVMGTMSYANVQISVDEVKIDNVYYVVGEDPTTGESIIRPTMTASWVDPDVWAPAVDPADIHDPDYYEIQVDNITTGNDKLITANTGSEMYSKHSVNLEERMALETGSLYKVSVQPFHYHTEDGTTVLAPNSGLPVSAYAITDLEVEFESDEDSITVIWDNLGVADFQYRIVYALGDYSNQTKQALINNKDGEISGLTIDSDDVNSYYDPITRRNKMSYTIDQNIYPGQVYSVLVEPMVDYYEGVPVTRNRNYPMINNVSTNINLSYVEIGETLRLQWEVPATFKVGSDNDQYELTEARLIQYRDGQGQTLAIFNGNAGAIGYYSVTRPIVETGYQLELTYEAVDDESKPVIAPISNLLVYSPSQLEVQPTRPEVPNLLTQNILNDWKGSYTTEEIRDLLAADYLVPGTSYQEDIDDVLTAPETYTVNTVGKEINFVWSAFRRIDVDRTSNTYNDVITDLNTYYDIWVTDDYDALNYANRIVSDQRYSSTDESSIIIGDSGDIMGFHTTLTGYYNNESGQVKLLEANKVYYIKVIAKKVIGNNEIKSEPTIVTVYFNAEGDAYAPPLITRPPLHEKTDETTSTGITIAWQQEWWEVLNPDAAEGEPLYSWTNEVWVDGTTLSDEPIEGAKHFPVYKNEDQVDALQEYLDNQGAGITLERRQIDLGKDPFGISNVYYRFLKIPYTEVQEAIETGKKTDSDYSFLEYFADLVEKDKDGSVPQAWKDIDVVVNPDNEEEVMYRETGLIPNTSYLFIVYPYRVINDSEVLYAHFPTPIIVATEPDDVVVNPDPTVPNLYVSDQQQRSISLQWRYNTDFTYEIRYGSNDDINSTESVPINIPADPSDPNYPMDGAFYEIDVTDLFPNSGYYFYIRAIQPETQTVSAWSNPVYGQTLDVATPEPPRGLGIAPNSQVKPYGYDTGVGKDYLSVSWLKNPQDKEDAGDSKVKLYYSYIIEVANNDDFVDPQYIVSGVDDTIKPNNVEILEKALIKVNGLMSNRAYYVRVKTRVTVVGSGEDQLIVKESKYYSHTIRILTVASQDEYDGYIDPALEILPGDNYELIYDKEEKSLTYRFRDDSKDAEGHADNNVDQRLISSLIAQNVYVYNIDIANFDNKPISKRRVIIPYSIMEAFDSYQVMLAIDAGPLTMRIPHDALMREVNRQKDQYGVAPHVEITLADMNAFNQDGRMPKDALSSVSIPQTMSVRVKSNRLNQALTYSDKPIELGLTTNNRYELYGYNPLVYSLDTDTRWTQMSGNYDRLDGAFKISTRNLGAYGVYLTGNSSEIKSVNPRHWSEPYKEAIDKKYTVSGLAGYNPSNPIPENEWLNIIDAIVTNKSDFDVQAYISQAQLSSLMYAGIKNDVTSGGNTVSREEAIHMLVMAMEIKTGTQIPVSASIKNTVANRRDILPENREGIGKAVASGLVSDLNNLRAKDALTYGEGFALWARAEGGMAE